MEGIELESDLDSRLLAVDSHIVSELRQFCSQCAMVGFVGELRIWLRALLSIYPHK